MHINKFSRVVLFIILFLPTIILVLSQLFFGGNEDDMILDYISAFGWALFMSCLIAWVYNKSNNLKFTTMNKWTKKVSASFLNRHYSNENERIVPMKGGVPIKVAPKGMFLVGLLTVYDELAFIDLRPKHVSIALTEGDQVATTDGVKIIGTVEITTKVFEDDKLLIRLISNEDEEEKILNSHLKKSIRKIISDKDWIDITIFREDKYENIKQQLLKDMKQTDCCFNVDEVMFINLSPSDKEFATLLELKRKQKEQAKFETEKEKATQERIKIEQETEEIRLAHKRKIETTDTEHVIKVTVLKSDAEITQKNKEHNAELKRKKKEHDEKIRVIFDLVMKFPQLSERLILGEINPSGLQALDEHRLKELEIQLEKEKNVNKVLQDFGLKMFDNNLARTQGQLDVVKQVASKQMGLDIKFEDSTIKIEKDTSSSVKDEVIKSQPIKSTENNNSESKSENEIKDRENK